MRQEELNRVLVEQILAKNQKSTLSSMRFPENLTKMYEKDLSANQKAQLEEYKAALMAQVKEKKALRQKEAAQEKETYPGLPLGKYCPEFRDLLKVALEAQIEEKRLKKAESQAKNRAWEENRLKRLSSWKEKEQKKEAGQLSTKKQIQELVREDYRRAIHKKEEASKRKVIRKEGHGPFGEIFPPGGKGYVMEALPSSAFVPEEEGASLEPQNGVENHLNDREVKREARQEEDFRYVDTVNENERKLAVIDKLNQRARF